MSAQKQTAKSKKKSNITIAVGKRKRAVARAYLKKGKGIVKINGKKVEHYFSNYLYLKVEEVLVLAGDKAKNLDIEVNVYGGGVSGQADAVRQAIARALVQFYDDEDLAKKFVAYDRSLLVYGPRRTEPHKPSRSKQGPRRKKQLSKR